MGEMEIDNDSESSTYSTSDGTKSGVENWTTISPYWEILWIRRSGVSSGSLYVTFDIIALYSG